MAQAQIVRLGFGPGTTIALVVLRGYGAAPAVPAPPVTPGLTPEQIERLRGGWKRHEADAVALEASEPAGETDATAIAVADVPAPELPPLPAAMAAQLDALARTDLVRRQTEALLAEAQARADEEEALVLLLVLMMDD
jgi:hypothetical protein